MNLLVVDNQTKHLDALVQFLPGTVSVVKKNDIDISDLESYDLIVFSGGSGVPTVAENPEVYFSEISIIQNFSKPILGVCLGAEIINVALGGTVRRLEERVAGNYEINISGRYFSVVEAHIMAIDNLAETLEPLADSKFGVEVFKHKTRPIVGVQFHPEISNNPELRDLIFNFLIK